MSYLILARTQGLSSLWSLAIASSVVGSGCRGSAAPSKSAPPIPVAVAAARVGTVPLTFSANGVVEPLQSVGLQARVSGPVVAVQFSEGDRVRAGQVLFVIDSTPYRIALEQAHAVLARDRASLAAASSNASRYESLVSKGYVTAEQAEQLNATAASLSATVRSDEAAAAAAELNLDYTSVRSPIDGQTGNLNVRVGNQVNGPTGAPLVVINSVAPVHVRFAVPERQLNAVRGAQHGGQGLVVQVRSEGSTTVRGVVDFIDNAVDSVSGTVLLKARVANRDQQLWPGEFVPVTLTLGDLPAAVLIPSIAVLQGPTGAFVFMPDAAGHVKQVPVVVSRVVGSVAVVSSGVSSGDRVVVDGQSLLYAGASINVQKTVEFAAR